MREHQNATVENTGVNQSAADCRAGNARQASNESQPKVLLTRRTFNVKQCSIRVICFVYTKFHVTAILLKKSEKNDKIGSAEQNAAQKVIRLLNTNYHKTAF